MKQQIYSAAYGRFFIASQGTFASAPDDESLQQGITLSNSVKGCDTMRLIFFICSLTQDKIHSFNKEVSW